MSSKFHALSSNFEPPAHFNNPFDYAPHPLICEAASVVCGWLEQLPSLKEEGKMFGVLVVEHEGQKGGVDERQVGFIAAFSGMLESSYDHPRFIPQIFNIESCKPYTEGQREIAAITAQIVELNNSPELQNLEDELSKIISQSEAEISELKSRFEHDKMARQEAREGATAEELKALNHQSSQQKKALKEFRAKWQEKIESKRAKIEEFKGEIKALKNQRAAISNQTQQDIFKAFTVGNFKGETASLYQLFERAKGELPPSGAGECAAPKLLQYAIDNDLKPLLMGEFWYGKSPESEPRHSGEFYTSCMGRCGVILPFMMEGLTLESTPNLELPEPVVLFEDDDIIVFDKPSGMLSVKGKSKSRSLDEYLPNLHTVHRLDMDTSGVIIFAKNVECKVELQRQFESRTTQKEYIAILDGELAPTMKKGSISLPLRPDILDRPRQVVDYKYGRETITEFEVLEQLDGRTRVRFRPLTGRSHQLRVHSAHPNGLATPIVGDRLYGRREKRLCLHAQSLTFRHPRGGEEVTVTAPLPF